MKTTQKPTPTSRRSKASPKARKAWETHYGGGDPIVFPSKHKREPWDDRPDPLPVFVLPGTREDVERMVETLACAVCGESYGYWRVMAEVSKQAVRNRVIDGLDRLGIRSRKERK